MHKNPRIRIWTKSTCPKCPAFKKFFESIARELILIEGYDYEYKDFDKDHIQALQEQVAITPALVLDGELTYQIAFPSYNEVLGFFKIAFNR